MPATADRASVASYAQFPAELDRDWLGRMCHLSGAELAVIRRRTDVRWRLTPQDFPRMQHLQGRIVKATIQFLKSGGRLVYSTCSIEPEENEKVADYIDREVPEVRFAEARSTMPIRDHLDGAFAALFVKA